MKIRFILSLLALFLVLSSFAQETSTAKPETPVFRAGAATANITPFLGMDIVGNFAPRPVAVNVHDELHVRCLALDDGETKLVFAVADNLHVVREVWDEIKTILQKTTGLPPENLMFSATHTHSSVTVADTKETKNPLLNHYRALFISRVVDGVQMALNRLEPAEIAWATGQLPQHVFNRRFMMKEGLTNPNPFGGEDRAVMNPSVPIRKNLADPAGPTNPQVYSLSVQSAEGRPIALLTNYWLHYVGNRVRDDLSADYFGEFCRLMEHKLGSDDQYPPFVAILANGPCGDVNSTDRSFGAPEGSNKPYEKLRLVAGDLADEVMQIREKMEYQKWVPLRAAGEELVLKVRRPTPEQIAWAESVLAKPEGESQKHRLERPYAARVLALKKAKEDTTSVFLQAFGIGDLGIPSIPFEVFTETGLQIRDQSPFPDTFTIELANGSGGYLPTPKQIDLGGYETWIGTNRVERDASEKIRDKVLDLLKRLR